MISIALIINSKNKLFIPDNKIINIYDLEKPKPEEIVSCQIDCTLNDGVFHEECFGFNGCVNSNFIKSMTYCEKDSDCIMYLGCCYEICKGEECLNIDYCSTSNKEFSLAHDFSCQNNIICKENKKCKGFSNSVCFNNICRIVS